MLVSHASHINCFLGYSYRLIHVHTDISRHLLPVAASRQMLRIFCRNAHDAQRKLPAPDVRALSAGPVRRRRFGSRRPVSRWRSPPGLGGWGSPCEPARLQAFARFVHVVTHTSATRHLLPAATSMQMLRIFCRNVHRARGPAICHQNCRHRTWAHFQPARCPSPRTVPGVKDLSCLGIVHMVELLDGVTGRELGVRSARLGG